MRDLWLLLPIGTSVKVRRIRGGHALICICIQYGWLGVNAVVTAPRQVAQFQTVFLGGLAEGFAAAGGAIQGLTTIDEALARSELSEERWVMAELLRMRGELLLLKDEPSTAQEYFLQALDWARRQGEGTAYQRGRSLLRGTLWKWEIISCAKIHLLRLSPVSLEAATTPAAPLLRGHRRPLPSQPRAPERS